MDVEFHDKSLEKLESDSSGSKLDERIIRSYRKVMKFIRAAKDPRDFSNMRSLNFEKLKGDRDGEYSFRLNKQWRLIVWLKGGDLKVTVVVVEIVDYH